MILHLPGGPGTDLPATAIISPADGALPADRTAASGQPPAPTALSVRHAIEISSPGYPSTGCPPRQRNQANPRRQAR
jgi:hypothetical protein